MGGSEGKWFGCTGHCKPNQSLINVVIAPESCHSGMVNCVLFSSSHFFNFFSAWSSFILSFCWTSSSSFRNSVIWSSATFHFFCSSSNSFFWITSASVKTLAISQSHALALVKFTSGNAITSESCSVVGISDETWLLGTLLLPLWNTTLLRFTSLTHLCLRARLNKVF